MTVGPRARSLIAVCAAVALGAPAALAGEANRIQVDRPSVSQSTSTVPPGALQIESGVEYARTRTGGEPDERRLTLDIALRIGLTERIEVTLEGEPLVRIRGKQDDTGNGDVSLKGKYRFLEKREGTWWPSLGVMPFVKLAVAHAPHGPDRPDFGLIGLASFDLPWRLGLDAWHFWNCCYWIDLQNLPGPGGGRLTSQLIDQDPPRYLADLWRDPLSFDQTRRPRRGSDGGKRQIRLNGDGVLFYPCTPAGVNGPLASFALKSLRRGLQDYEYLWLLRKRGIDTGAIVQRLVPQAGEWERDPAAWDQARLELGSMLEGSEGK